MDKTQDVILGVLGTQWERSRPGGVEAYLESIKRISFDGRKIMLNWDIHPNTRSMLISHGFELVDLPIPNEPFFHARMRVCWEYLKDHHKEFRYIFWLDVKDLVLQSNPSVWMEENTGNAKLIGSTECVSIMHEETNKEWAQAILGEDKYQQIKHEEVINGGTWAGESEVIAEVFHQVHLGCQTYKDGFPPCQIWINYVMRQSPFKEVLRIPRWSEGFAACLHPCWSPWRVPCWPFMRDPHPTLDKDTCVLYPGTVPDSKNQMIPFNNMTNVSIPWAMDKGISLVNGADPLRGIECKVGVGKPFAIVHGYDRDWGIKALFDYKYHNETYNFELAKSEFNIKAALCIPQRGLRSIKREKLVGVALPQTSVRSFKRH